MAKTKCQKRPKSPLGHVSASSLYRRRLHSKRLKKVSWKDDIEDMAVENVEFNDPAILAAVPLTTKYRYSREDLVKMRHVPLSMKRPEFLDSAYDNSNGIWDPELWHYNRKTSDTPTENGSRTSESDNSNHRRRSGDPRERIRKEQDGIVLSPQRRSFNSGCFVPVREPARANRSHSPLGKNEGPPHISAHREIPTSAGTRRIGSGRILPWDFQEKSDVDNEFGYRRERRDTDRDREDRYERRSFGREYDMNREKEKDRHVGRNGRFGDRRRMDNKEEEPEWFSGGPVSQTDTIELRGFEESDKGGKRKQTAAQKKRANERAARKNAESLQFLVKDEDGSNKVRAAPAPQPKVSPVPDKGAAGDQQEEKKKEPKETSQPPALDLEDILKCDSISGFMTNGVGGGDSSTGSSRFSQWFNREKSPPHRLSEDGRNSSLQEDNHHHHLIKNLLNDISEPNVSIPGDAESYFAPISPAANTGSVIGGQRGPQAGSKPVNLMEMLQRGKQPMPLTADVPPVLKNPMGKVLSLEELEARMLQGGGGNGSDVGPLGGHPPKKSHSQLKDDDEIAAFKRLLTQVSANHAIPPVNNGPIPQKSQPMTLLEMLSHSQQQDEAARLAQMIANSSSHPGLNNDLGYKFQQMQNQQQRQQLDMLSKLMNARQSNPKTPPLPEMGIAQSRELLNRPEAQAILQGLKRGDITPQHLYQQLANPAMQPRHRELLHTILKMQGGTGVGPSPRVLSPVPPHPLFQQQQLRVSPLPPNAYCVSPILATSPNTLTVPALHQRIPSPRELQVHTQNIMQRALIKKKLEEQQENYRKKQEMQHRGQSPGGGASPCKSVSSPTPLAFTPTAVLRKMTADKDDGTKDSNKGTDPNKLPPGRPVTGMRPQPQQPPPQQQPQQLWNNQFQQLKQPVGRPIVKANSNFPQNNQQEQQFYQQQQRLFNQQQQQQQQQRKSGGQQQFAGQGQFSQFPNSQPQYPQLTQQQLRAQHQQQQHVRSQHQQQQPFAQPPNWQQLLQSQNYENKNSGQVGRGVELSPTSNQLARWFSPDLLERARNGKLPNLPSASLTQHALSLEEIERQTAPAVHN